jgi:hypothetical protein
LELFWDFLNWPLILARIAGVHQPISFPSKHLKTPSKQPSKTHPNHLHPSSDKMSLFSSPTRKEKKTQYFLLLEIFILNLIFKKIVQKPDCILFIYF